MSVFTPNDQKPAGKYIPKFGTVIAGTAKFHITGEDSQNNVIYSVEVPPYHYIGIAADIRCITVTGDVLVQGHLGKI